MMRSIGRDILVVGATLLSLSIGGVLLAWSGLYNIAASKGHWPIVEAMLRFGMSNSVELRAAMIDAPDLRSEGLIAVGGNHYRSGCAYCHGGPGVKASPVSQSTLPPPPDLRNVSDRWNDSQLFWIVKNGIKYTGMPAWVSQHRDEEVWAVIAFLKALNSFSPDAYRALKPDMDASSSAIARDAAANCDGCHGAPGKGPRSAMVPVIEGQRRDYLIAALEDYASGVRESGFMQPIASDLAPAAIAAFASHYADRARPIRDDVTGAADVEAGRRLAVAGAAQFGIPACNSCHATDALASYPLLWGQSATYIAAQLRQWKAGAGRRGERSVIMAPIAKRLSDQQIEAVAAFYAAFRPEQAAR